MSHQATVAYLNAARCGNMTGLVFFGGQAIGSIHAMASNGFNALMVAAQYRQVTALKWCLEHGVGRSIDKEDRKSGHTSLMFACMVYPSSVSSMTSSMTTYHDPQCAALFVDYGADVMKQDLTGKTCLHHAARGCLTGIICVLAMKLTKAKFRALRRVRDKDGRVAADYLSPYVSTADTDTSIDASADASADVSSIDAALKWLVSSFSADDGDDNDDDDDDNNRRGRMFGNVFGRVVPQQPVIKLKRTGIVAPDQSAIVEVPIGDYLASATRRGDLSTLERFHVHLHHVDSDGRNVLMSACVARKPDVLKWCLAKLEAFGGLELVREIVNGRDDYGCAAVHFAAAGGKLPTQPSSACMEVIVKAGADVNAVDNAGFTPLLIAAQNGYPDVVRFLLEQPNCDMDMHVDGKDALMLAQASLAEARDGGASAGGASAGGVTSVEHLETTVKMLQVARELDGRFTPILRNDVEALRRDGMSIVRVRHPKLRVTAPAFAALLGRPRCLEYFVQLMGLDDFVTMPQTILMQACCMFADPHANNDQEVRLACVRVLLERVCELEAEMEDTAIAKSFKSKHKSPGARSKMMKRVAHVHVINMRSSDTGDTVLHFAAASGYDAIVRFLLQHPGMNAGVQNNAGMIAANINTGNDLVMKAFTEFATPSVGITEDGIKLRQVGAFPSKLSAVSAVSAAVSPKSSSKGGAGAGAGAGAGVTVVCQIQEKEAEIQRLGHTIAHLQSRLVMEKSMKMFKQKQLECTVNKMREDQCLFRQFSRELMSSSSSPSSLSSYLWRKHDLYTRLAGTRTTTPWKYKVHYDVVDDVVGGVVASQRRWLHNIVLTPSAFANFVTDMDGFGTGLCTNNNSPDAEVHVFPYLKKRRLDLMATMRSDVLVAFECDATFLPSSNAIVEHPLRDFLATPLAPALAPVSAPYLAIVTRRFGESVQDLLLAPTPALALAFIVMQMCKILGELQTLNVTHGNLQTMCSWKVVSSSATATTPTPTPLPTIMLSDYAIDIPVEMEALLTGTEIFEAMRFIGTTFLAEISANDGSDDAATAKIKTIFKALSVLPRELQPLPLQAWRLLASALFADSVEDVDVVIDAKWLLEQQKRVMETTFEAGDVYTAHRALYLASSVSEIVDDFYMFERLAAFTSAYHFADMGAINVRHRLKDVEWKRGPEIGRGSCGVVFRLLKSGRVGSPASGSVVKMFHVLRNPELFGLCGGAGGAGGAGSGGDGSVNSVQRRLAFSRELGKIWHEAYVHSMFTELGSANILRLHGVVCDHDDDGGNIVALVTEEAVCTLDKWDFSTCRQIGRFMACVAQALVALHDKGIVHRDIKEENVFVMADDCAKLGDFGSAAILGLTSLQGRVPMEMEGNLLVKAPEVFSQRQLGFAEDVYAMGITFSRTVCRCYGNGVVDDDDSHIDDSHIHNRDVVQKCQELLELLEVWGKACESSGATDDTFTDPAFIVDLIQVLQGCCQEDFLKRMCAKEVVLRLGLGEMSSSAALALELSRLRTSETCGSSLDLHRYMFTEFLPKMSEHEPFHLHLAARLLLEKFDDSADDEDGDSGRNFRDVLMAIVNNAATAMHAHKKDVWLAQDVCCLMRKWRGCFEDDDDLEMVHVALFERFADSLVVREQALWTVCSMLQHRRQRTLTIGDAAVVRMEQMIYTALGEHPHYAPVVSAALELFAALITCVGMERMSYKPRAVLVKVQCALKRWSVDHRVVDMTRPVSLVMTTLRGWTKDAATCPFTSSSPIFGMVSDIFGASF